VTGPGRLHSGGPRAGTHALRAGTHALLTASLALAAAGCVYLQSRTDYEKDTDFSAFETFSVSIAQPADGSGRLSEPGYAHLVDNRALHEIRRLLVEKGLTEVDPAVADLHVSFHLTTTEEIRVRDRPGHTRWLRVDVREIDYQSYTKGTLVIDIADREKNLLVWHGAVKGSVETDAMPTTTLEKAIRRLLGKYPPRWQ